jgi:hypothetical protein
MSDQRNEIRLQREIEALERELAHARWVITELADQIAKDRACDQPSRSAPSPPPS